MSNPNYQETDKYIEIKIHKPLYGNFVYIRDAHIKKSKGTGKPLKITIPNGVGIVSGEDWLKDAKRIEKEFKIKGVPMVLYGNDVPIKGGESL